MKSYVVTEEELKSLNCNFVWNDAKVADFLKSKKPITEIHNGKVDLDNLDFKFCCYDGKQIKIYVEEI
jgi:hypothetical protein